MNRVWNYLYTLAVAVLLTGCGGTEAGNPTSTGEIAYNPVSGQFAQYLLDAVCRKFNECYSNASAADCGAGVLEQSNLPRGFGLSSSFGTARDMVDAERNGLIRPDYIHFTICVDEVRKLSCSSNAVNSAAPTGSTDMSTAYSGVINMIPTSGTSCAGVF